MAIAMDLYSHIHLYGSIYRFIVLDLVDRIRTIAPN